MSLKKIILPTLFAILFLTNCSTIKTVKIMKSGEISQKEFKVEIPFEYRLGLVVLKVKINGTEYDFVLDTGAPNVISKELAKALNVIPENTQKVGDSHNTELDLDFTKIGNINIGGVDFMNTGAVIADLSLSNEIACLNIDGFIGSNLMRMAIWKFDYQNQIITITNNMDSLNISSGIEKIPFYPEITGTPLFDINVNGQVERNVVIDLGSNGDLTLSNKTYEKINKTHPSFPKMTRYGTGYSGLHGSGTSDTTISILASNITFGDVVMTNQIIEFSNGSSTIGMNFFNNYDLIINWFSKEISLIKKKEYNYSYFADFGFSWGYEDEKVFVNSLILGSKAEKDGLKLGDQIIEFNKIDYTNMSVEKWCEIIEKTLKEDLKKLDLNILRDGKELKFNIYKEVLLK